jgi:hypothetical protein
MQNRLRHLGPEDVRATGIIVDCPNKWYSARYRLAWFLIRLGGRIGGFRSVRFIKRANW